MSSYIPEPGFENTIRRALAEVVADAAPAPLRRSARRRVRMRQASSAVAAVLLLAVGAAGALTAWQQVFPREEYIRVAGSGRLLNTRGAGGQYPCNAAAFGMTDQESSCVATGSFRGMGWTLGASVDDKHGLCLITGTSGGGNIAGGMGASCDDYVPGEIALSETRLDDLPMLAVGAVPGETERLYLKHGGDERFELQVYPTPANFPLDLKFYLVWLPDNAQTLYALDDSDEIIATRSLDGSDSLGGSQETERVTIAGGGIDDQPWDFEAYGDTIDGQEVVCTQVKFEMSEQRNESGFCHMSYPDRDISVNLQYPVEIPGRVAVSGVMSSTIESLVLELDKSQDSEVAILKPTKEIDPSLRFFVAFPRTDAEGNISGELIARDSNDRVVARQRI